MGAEIVWPPSPAEGGPLRTGALRFGPFFNSAAAHDDFAGRGSVEDYGDFCRIVNVAGEMTRRDHDDILETCAGWGFQRAEVERHGAWWEYDLTARPFRRVRR